MSIFVQIFLSFIAMRWVLVMSILSSNLERDGDINHNDNGGTDITFGGIECWCGVVWPAWCG